MIKVISGKISGRMKNVLKVSTGTLLGQIIMFVSLPLLTRMYGAEIVGVSTLIASFAAIVNALSDIGISNALMLQEDELKAVHIYEVISTVSFVISLIAAVGIVVFDYFFDLKLGMHWIFAVIYIFLSFFLSKQSQICYTWLTKKQEYGLLMKNPILNNLYYTGAAFLLGLAGFHKYGYYIGYIAGLAVSLLRMKFRLPKKMFTITAYKYIDVLRDNKNFVYYEMPNNILAQLKTQLPVLLIKIFFNNQILGYYSICVKILNIPINLLANAMGRVFFQVASEYKDDIKKVGEFTYSNITKAIKLVIIPMVLLIGFGDRIILLLFGTGYEMAGNMLRIVAIQSFIFFISLTVQGVSTITGKQKWSFISLLLQIILVCIFFTLGIVLFHNIYIALGFMSLTVIIVYVAFYSILFHYMELSAMKFIFGITRSIVVILVLAVVIRKIVEITGILTFMEGIFI